MDLQDIFKELKFQLDRVVWLPHADKRPYHIFQPESQRLRLEPEDGTQEGMRKFRRDLAVALKQDKKAWWEGIKQWVEDEGYSEDIDLGEWPEEYKITFEILCTSRGARALYWHYPGIEIVPPQPDEAVVIIDADEPSQKLTP